MSVKEFVSFSVTLKASSAWSVFSYSDRLLLLRKQRSSIALSQYKEKKDNSFIYSCVYLLIKIEA